MPHMDREVAQAFLAGELSSTARDWWQAHLAECMPCRELMAHERALAGLLRLDAMADKAIAPGEDFRARVHALEARVASHRSQKKFVAALLWSATLGAAAGLTYRLGTSPPSGPFAGGALSVSRQERDTRAHLDALEVLAAHPWLTDDAETIRWLDILVRQPGGQ